MPIISGSKGPTTAVGCFIVPGKMASLSGLKRTKEIGARYHPWLCTIGASICSEAESSCFFWQEALLSAYDRRLEDLWIHRGDMDSVRVSEWRGRQQWQLSLTGLQLLSSTGPSQEGGHRGDHNPWQRLLAKASRVRLWLDRLDRLPRKILVHDKEGLLLSVKFRNIEVNSPISQEEFELFRLDQSIPNHGSSRYP